MSAALSVRLQAWHAGGRTLTLGGRNYFVRSGGQGPALLLLGGYPVGSYDWHALWPQLERNFHLIAPDMLGHGFSDKPADGDYTVAAHASFHDALLDALEVRECHVVACDLGVSVLQEMLARRREQPTQRRARIKSVVLLNGGLCPRDYQPRVIQRLLVSPLGAWLAARITQPMFEKPVRRMYGNAPAPTQEILDDFWALVNVHGGLQLAHRTGAFWKTRMEHSERLLGALMHTTVPVRLINGAADPNSAAHMVQAYLRHVPQADVVSLQTLGHWPQVQDPQRVAQHIREFCLT